MIFNKFILVKLNLAYNYNINYKINLFNVIYNLLTLFTIITIIGAKNENTQC